jgi:tetratricopeptide (TPR) repeat protein
LIRLTPHRGARCISVSPDGHWVATGSYDSDGARVWDAATGRLVKELVLPDKTWVQVGFSQDGKWLATSNPVCRLWAVGSWQEGPSPGEGTAFAFSPDPDGKLLAVETGHGVVRLVDPDSGREYARLEDANQDRARHMAFSPDGTQLVVNSEGLWLRSWDLRAIREELARRGLDWDLPPFPPASPPAADHPPLKVLVYQNWVDRGLDHARQGQSEQALAAYRRAAVDSAPAFAAADGKSAEPADPMLWQERACLAVQIGDLPGYRKLCRRMLERFGQSKSSFDIGVLAYTCVLGPDALGNSQRALELAQQLTAMTPLGPDSHLWAALVLGLAHYRAGGHDKAVECLQKAVTDDPDWHKEILNWLVLAMAHQRLGHARESRQWLQKADNWIAGKTRETSPETGFVPPGWQWQDWLVVQFLRREAESLVPGTDKDKP